MIIIGNSMPGIMKQGCSFKQKNFLIRAAFGPSYKFNLGNNINCMLDIMIIKKSW